MSRNAQPITDNAAFTVVKTRLHLPNGTPTDYFANQRTDNGEVIGQVSTGYGLVQNADAIDAVEGAFSAYGLGDFKRQTRVTRGGAGLFVTYDFGSRNIVVPKVNDILGLRLTLLNSFDGSSPLAFEVGYLRLVCLNGMKALVRELALTKKHFGNIDLAFIKARLAEAVGKAESSAQLFALMAEIVLAPLEGEHLLLNLAVEGILTNKAALAIMEIWRKPRYQADAARNLYNLYNAITQYLSHDVDQQRFENARKINGTVTATFAKISRDRDALTPLLLPPPAKK